MVARCPRIGTCVYFSVSCILFAMQLFMIVVMMTNQHIAGVNEKYWLDSCQVISCTDMTPVSAEVDLQNSRFGRVRSVNVTVPCAAFMTTRNETFPVQMVDCFVNYYSTELALSSPLFPGVDMAFWSKICFGLGLITHILSAIPSGFVHGIIWCRYRLRAQVLNLDGDSDNEEGLGEANEAEDTGTESE